MNGGVTAAIGILMVIFLAAIFIPASMSSVMSANTTGWTPLISQMLSNYLPVVGLAAILIIVLMASIMRGRK